jgi:hypothetical protein
MPTYVVLMNWTDQGVFASQGNVRTTTMRGFSAEAGRGVIEKSRQLSGSSSLRRRPPRRQHIAREGRLAAKAADELPKKRTSEGDVARPDNLRWSPRPDLALARGGFTDASLTRAGAGLRSRRRLLVVA